MLHHRRTRKKDHPDKVADMRRRRRHCPGWRPNNSLQLTGPAAEKRLTESEFGWPGS